MDKKKSLGYIVGQIFATILFGCLASILVALTIMIVEWILML